MEYADGIYMAFQKPSGQDLGGVGWEGEAVQHTVAWWKCLGNYRGSRRQGGMSLGLPASPPISLIPPGEEASRLLIYITFSVISWEALAGALQGSSEGVTQRPIKERLVAPLLGVCLWAPFFLPAIQ